MSPFDRVAAACSAVLRNTSTEPVDDATWMLAARHGVLPLLPSDDQPARASELRCIAQRQLAHCSELRRISDALRGTIDFIALKGPALSLQLYGSVSQRDSVDLDILVRPRNVANALEILHTIGYAGQRLESAAFRHWLHHQHELALSNREHNVLLELQWAWAQHHFAVERDIEACFEERTELALPGAAVQVLSAEDTLLYLAVHGAKHGWSSLSLVTDVAAAGLRLDIDWDVATQRAQQIGILRLLEIAAVLSASLLRIDLPIRSSAAARATAGALEQKLRVNDRQQSMQLFVKSREKTRDRMRVWWRLASAPSPTDTAWVTLPDRMFGAYYLLRPIRLLLKPFNRGPAISGRAESTRDHVIGHLSDPETMLLEQTPRGR